MGTCTSLISNSSREWCDLGKVFLDEEIVEILQKKPDSARLVGWLKESEGDLNHREVDWTPFAEAAVAWMLKHDDWRFVTEYDDTLDEVYLAESAADAREYREEFGDEGIVFKKSGDAWKR